MFALCLMWMWPRRPYPVPLFAMTLTGIVMLYMGVNVSRNGVYSGLPRLYSSPMYRWSDPRFPPGTPWR